MEALQGSSHAYISRIGTGKHSYQIYFGPITMEQYRGSRIKAPPVPMTQRRPAHVKTCTCSQCQRFRKRPQKEVSRVTYHSSIRLVQAMFETSSCYYSSSGKTCNVLWTSKIQKNATFQNLDKHQRINQFPRSGECTRKDSLSKNVSLMADKHGKQHFNFLSHGYILPKERDALKQECQAHPETYWIVKPASAACGRGVYITREYSDLPLETSLDEYVVEQYITNPLLINGYKFDLRLYVAVLSFDPLRVYLHEEGLTRFATEQYDLENVENRFMHLTNYSINKYNVKEEEDEQRQEEEDDRTSTKWKLSALKQHLSENGYDTSKLFDQIQDSVIKTMLSIEPKVVRACQQHVPHRKNCFELFGFDFLIDDTLRPWLLEVNLSPSLVCDTELDLQVKSKVLSDLLNLASIRPEQIPVNDAPKKTKPSESRTALEKRQGRALTPMEKALLKESEEEDTRSGGFERIFPRYDVSILFRDVLQLLNNTSRINMCHSLKRSERKQHF